MPHAYPLRPKAPRKTRVVMFQPHRSPAGGADDVANDAGLIYRKGRANGPVVALACVPASPTSPGPMDLASRRLEQLTQLNLLLCHRPAQLSLELLDSSTFTVFPAWTNTYCLDRRHFLSLFVLETPPCGWFTRHVANRTASVWLDWRQAPAGRC